MKEVIIYTLTCPVTNEVRYVGKTSEGIRERMYRHLSEYYAKKEKYTNKGKWIAWLKSRGLKPKVDIIDNVPDSEWEFWEKYWIEQFKAWGFCLTNMTNGGDDGADWTGKKHSDNTIKKLRSNNPNMKTVVMYDEFMTPVKKFKSIREAERESEIKRQLIKFSCQERGKACGCYFRFSEEEFEEQENWKEFIELREYNYKPLSVKIEIETIKEKILESKSYRDLIDKMGLKYNERLRRKIFDLVKRSEVDTSHFKRTKK